MLRTPLQRASQARIPAGLASQTRGLIVQGVSRDKAQSADAEASWEDYIATKRIQKANFDLFSQLGSTQTRENAWQPFHSLHNPPRPSEVTLSALVAAGAHYGHSKGLMHPAYAPFAYGVRAGVVIIDLDATLPYLRRAANVVRGVAARGGSVVFVGSRPELAPAVRKAAQRMGHNAFHIGEKWKPGTLTNKHSLFGFETVQKTKVVPDLVIFLNPLQNMSAIRECALEHIPTIGIVDSNVDPRIVMYPIPANDDSVRTGELVAGLLSIAGREGIEQWYEHLRRKAAKRRQEREVAARQQAEGDDTGNSAPYEPARGRRANRASEEDS